NEVRKAQHRDGAKVGDDNGSEHESDFGGADRLHVKQSGQNADGDQHNPRFKHGRGHLQAFHGGQNRNGGRDNTVSPQQSGSEHADVNQPTFAAARCFDGRYSQRHQGQNSAFAFIVGAKHEQNIFNRNGEDQRPDDQRQNSQNIVGRDGDSVMLGETLS